MRNAIMAIILVVIFASPSLAAEQLRIATEGAYPPFNYIDESGRPAGFDVDIAKALCKAMNRECDIVAIKWEDILDGLERGDYDMIVASMGKTPEREARVAFSDSYYRSRTAFIGKSGKGFALSPEKLKGKTLGAQKDTIQADYIEKTFGDVADIVLFDTTDDCFDGLAKGKIDLMLTDALTALEFLKTDQGASFDFIGDPLPVEHLCSTAHIQMRKNETEQMKAVNKALRDIRLNGSYERINNTYFPFSIY